jgi:hypothetical protein
VGWGNGRARSHIVSDVERNRIFRTPREYEFKMNTNQNKTGFTLDLGALRVELAIGADSGMRGGLAVSIVMEDSAPVRSSGAGRRDAYAGR